VGWSLRGDMPVAEHVEFYAGGQKANTVAMHAARVFAGGRKVLRFVEDYYGWADELLAVGETGYITDTASIGCLAQGQVRGGSVPVELKQDRRRRNRGARRR